MPMGPLIIQRHLRGLDAFGPLAASLLIASAILSFRHFSPYRINGRPSIAVTSVSVLGILCTALAMLLMFYLVTHAGPSRASLITYINPAVAALLGVGLLHERLGSGGLTAFALILLGSWLASRGGPPQLVRRGPVA